MKPIQDTLFEGHRQTLTDAYELTRQSLCAYGESYKHWCAAFSGGKDSTAMTTMVAQMIALGKVPAPKSLTVLYADTRMELPPLQTAAHGVMDELRYQVPQASKVDGWVEVPIWVMQSAAAYPRNCYTLPDGTVAKPGQWIVKRGDRVEVETA